MGPALDQESERITHDAGIGVIPPDFVIAKTIAQKDVSAQECVDHLIAAALDGGGSDNVTAVLLRRA